MRKLLVSLQFSHVIGSEQSGRSILSLLVALT